MEILAWNTDKQRLTTMDVEFTEENTTWFEGCTKESDIHKITDVDGGILIGKAGYTYPVWIGGQSRTDIQYSRVKARKLEKLALNP
jgi:prophage tail gpP-like protein